MQLWIIYKILFFTTTSAEIFTLIQGNEQVECSIPIVELFSSEYLVPFGMAFVLAVINKGACIYNLDIVVRGTMYLFLVLVIDYILLLAGLFKSKDLVYSFIALVYLVYAYIQDVLMQREYEATVHEVPSLPARRRNRPRAERVNDVYISRPRQAMRFTENQDAPLDPVKEPRQSCKTKPQLPGQL